MDNLNILAQEVNEVYESNGLTTVEGRFAAPKGDGFYPTNRFAIVLRDNLRDMDSFISKSLDYIGALRISKGGQLLTFVPQDRLATNREGATFIAGTNGR